MTPEDRRMLTSHYRMVKVYLNEQLFWGYPPPLIDTGWDASLSLYMRYKYGRDERKYFRNYNRKMAAKFMARFYLLSKEVGNVR